MAVAEVRHGGPPTAAALALAGLKFHDLLCAQEIDVLRQVADEDLQRRDKAHADHPARRQELRERFDQAVRGWVDSAATELKGPLADQVALAAEAQRAKFRRNRLSSRAEAVDRKLDEVIDELCAVLGVTVLLDVWLPERRQKLIQDALSHFDSEEVAAAWTLERGAAQPPSGDEAFAVLDAGMSELEVQFSAVTSKTNTRLPARLVSRLTGSAPVAALQEWFVDELGRMAFPDGLREPNSRGALTLATHLLMGRRHPKVISGSLKRLSASHDITEDHELRSAWREVESEFRPSSARPMSEHDQIGVWDRVIAAAMLAVRACGERNQSVQWPEALVAEVFSDAAGQQLLSLLPIGGTELPWWEEPFTPAGLRITTQLKRDLPDWTQDELSVEAELVVTNTLVRLRKSLRQMEREGTPFSLDGPTKLNSFVSNAAGHELNSQRSGRIRVTSSDDIGSAGHDERVAAPPSTMAVTGTQPSSMFSVLARWHQELEHWTVEVWGGEPPSGAADLQLWLEWRARHEELDTAESPERPASVEEAPASHFDESFLQFTETSVWAVEHPNATLSDRRRSCLDAKEVLRLIVAAQTPDTGEWSK